MCLPLILISILPNYKLLHVVVLFYRIYKLNMSEVQCDSSSESDSSDVLDRTPVKENYNKTIITRPLGTKNMHLHYAALSEPEESPLKKKDEKTYSLDYSSPRHTENCSKSSATVKESQYNTKSKKVGMLRSSSSPEAHVNSEQTKKYGKACANMSRDYSSSEESDVNRNYTRRDGKDIVESTDSETSETLEESLQSLKLASKVGKLRWRRNIINLSDSEEFVTEDETDKCGQECADLSKVYSSPKKESNENRRRHGSYAVECGDSETSQNKKGIVMDTSEESLHSLKLPSKAGKCRQRIHSSDSEECATDKADVRAALNSPELRSSALCSYRERKCTIDSSDSESVEIAKKSATIHDISRSKYREEENIIQSSDSEERPVNEVVGRPSISDESSPEITLDENAAIEEVESNRENGNQILETSNLGKFPVQDKSLKLSVKSTVDVNDCSVKAVKEYNLTSNDCVQERALNSSETVQGNVTANKNKTICLVSDTSSNDSTVLQEVSSSSLLELAFMFRI
jgi:hypothetical protein